MTGKELEGRTIKLGSGLVMGVFFQQDNRTWAHIYVSVPLIKGATVRTYYLLTDWSLLRVHSALPGALPRPNIKQCFMALGLIWALKVCETCQENKGASLRQLQGEHIPFTGHTSPRLYLFDRLTGAFRGEGPHLERGWPEWHMEQPVFLVDNTVRGIPNCYIKHILVHLNGLLS